MFQWKRLDFYYLARASGGRIDLRDLTTYTHYDRDFRKHEKLATFFERTLDRGHPYLRPGGIEALLGAEKKGGPFFQILARLLQAKLTRRAFFGDDPSLEAPHSIEAARRAFFLSLPKSPSATPA